MSPPAIVLLHSPLVGPLAWQPVAEALGSSGYNVIVPALSAALTKEPPYYQALGRAIRDAVRAVTPTHVVLAAHSGAGPLVPSAVAALRDQVPGVLFVDATLPHPGVSWFDSVPDGLAEQLRRLATAGRLPPWNEWFPPRALEALLPDPRLRSRFAAELPCLPLAYFDEPAPLVEGWRSATCRYLRLSEAYDDVAEQARREGWPVSRYEGHHLSMHTDPHVVTRHLEALVSDLQLAAAN